MYMPTLLLPVLALVSLAAAKDISGTAYISVTDVSTGKALGCLNASGRWVNQVKASCHHFFAQTGSTKKGSPSIWSAEKFPCGFALSDPTDPTSENIFDCSTTLDFDHLSSWSVKSSVLSTDPEGRQFVAFGVPTTATSEVAFGSGVSGTTAITLTWVNV